MARVDHLHVVEIDRDLIARLKKQYPKDKLTIHEGDALEFDFGQLGPNLQIVGNLPYNISTPLLFHTGQLRPPWYGTCTSCCRRNVVERMVALPGESEYSRLSVMLQYRFYMDWLLDVPPESFDPAPKVDSAVVRLIPRPLGRTHGEGPGPAWKRWCRPPFSQRRKMLRNTPQGTGRRSLARSPRHQAHGPGRGRAGGRLRGPGQQPGQARKLGTPERQAGCGCRAWHRRQVRPFCLPDHLSDQTSLPRLGRRGGPPAKRVKWRPLAHPRCYGFIPCYD